MKYIRRVKEANPSNVTLYIVLENDRLLFYKGLIHGTDFPSVENRLMSKISQDCFRNLHSLGPHKNCIVDQRTYFNL